jgi:asparagine synthase (glutamine-hydrolysing)
MCGICGAFNFNPNHSVEPALLERMNDEIAHRGPDDAGTYLSRNVAIGMRRLSIVDVAHGHQPISNEDGTVWIVFNGEIYNHAELAKDLKARGHSYVTRSDTETIVHLYEEYGPDCVKHLRGMFAFLIWDSRNHRLFGARDRLGIKPFYYSETSSGFLFGSEIKSLFASGQVKPILNRAALPEYLAFGYLSGDQTLYEGVRKLMPGHRFQLQDGKLKIDQYWDLPVVDASSAKPEEFYIETYRAMLEEAVVSHLMSDVPLGIFLSGGIDSSAVAALAVKHRQEPIDTFSVGYAEEQYSELGAARRVSEHIGSQHHEVRVSRQEFFDALPQLIWQEDEPIVWPSSISLYFVARLAQEKVKVVLTGEGSDETLAGYTRYAWTLKNAGYDGVYRKIAPAGVRKAVRNSIANSHLLGATLRRKLQHTFLARDGADWSSFYFDNFYSGFSGDLQSQLLASEVLAQANGAYDNVLDIWEGSRGDMLHRLLYTDTKTYLVELLMKQDQMSMAASLESRVPFLDHPLVEFTASIPARYNLKGLSGKHVLKAAVGDLLPHDIIYRKKLGFPTPIRDWLRGPEVDRVKDLLLGPRTLSRGLFQETTIRRLVNEHASGHIDHTDRIWRLLNFEQWMRVCIEGDRQFNALDLAGTSAR